MLSRVNRIPKDQDFFKVDFPQLNSLYHRPQKKRFDEVSESNFKPFRGDYENIQVQLNNQQQSVQTYQNQEINQNENLRNNASLNKANFHYKNAAEVEQFQQNSQNNSQQQSDLVQQTDREHYIKQQIEELKKQLKDYQSNNKQELNRDQILQQMNQSYEDPNELLKNQDYQARNLYNENEQNGSRQEEKQRYQYYYESQQQPQNASQQNQNNFEEQTQKVQTFKPNSQEFQERQPALQRNSRINIPLSSDDLRLQRKIQQFSLTSKKEEEEFSEKIRMGKLQELENLQKKFQDQRQLEQKMKNQKLMDQIQYREALREQQKLKMSYDLELKVPQYKIQEEEFQKSQASFYNTKQEPLLNYNKKLLPEIKSKTKSKNIVFDPITYQQKVFQVEQKPVSSLGNIKPKEKLLFNDYDEDKNVIKSSKAQQQEIDGFQQFERNHQGDPNQQEKQISESIFQNQQNRALMRRFENSKRNKFEPIETGAYKIQQLQAPKISNDIRFYRGTFYHDTKNILL